ncbi:hypothetical protein [Pararobbsia silviterrae]|uniref:Uncharacterized protein n=1 Tax=Pararobbsia silviterrae TaxID=1792498 RepID=A0A494Y4L1_9BURK|nr:hypothetical protein [Pararobbsia silviterrae]RKP57659.1 hypothetical protein D7S86_06875 [Pararobbsia silviterrae]
MDALLNLPQYIAAIGALGTSAFGLVDASKLIRGGPSNFGFGFIAGLVGRLFQASDSQGFKRSDLLETLRSNWINGVSLDDQISKAKALIKLMLDNDTVTALAGATGCNANQLKSVMDAMAQAQSLQGADMDTWGRFDLALTALLDEAYQRADQKYRNYAKGLACVVATGLALGGAWILHAGATEAKTMDASFWKLNDPDLWTGLITGLLATPLAPVAKDLSSALTAAMQVMQFKAR